MTRSSSSQASPQDSSATARLTQSLHRWKAARHVALGTILLMGSAQAIAELARPHESSCERQFRETVEVYSGIGIRLEQHHGSTVVREVFTNSPAAGRIFPGAHLVAVDGQHADSPFDWQELIRGPEGSKVVLELAYHGQGHQEVHLIREQIQFRRGHVRSGF